MNKQAILIEQVWKKYKIRQPFNQGNSLKELLNRPFRLIDKKNISSNSTFWALKDVSLTIKHGESIGIIGKNGAGKSTLLKLLSRITRPTLGKITLFEKVTSLLEIGTGFNADLSGKDNIYLNGSFLGLKKEEIDEIYEDIVSFSGIAEFIHAPVKYYSSGMYVRLAFSIATHISPEALLLDEVLSVGDGEFKEKSFNKMQQLLKSGATIMLVSHSEDNIIQICNRVIWLDKGIIKMDDDAAYVVNEYKKFIKHQLFNGGESEDK